MNPNPSPRVKPQDMDYYRELLAELIDRDSGLSEWEVDFVESLSHWDGDFTEKQAKTLEGIHTRRT